MPDTKPYSVYTLQEKGGQKRYIADCDTVSLIMSGDIVNPVFTDQENQARVFSGGYLLKHDLKIQGYKLKEIKS